MFLRQSRRRWKNLVKILEWAHQYHTNRKVKGACILIPASHGTGVAGGAVRSVFRVSRYSRII
jgi:ribosomal protein S5